MLGLFKKPEKDFQVYETLDGDTSVLLFQERNKDVFALSNRVSGFVVMGSPMGRRGGILALLPPKQGHYSGLVHDLRTMDFKTQSLDMAVYCPENVYISYHDQRMQDYLSRIPIEIEGFDLFDALTRVSEAVRKESCLISIKIPNDTPFLPATLQRLEEKGLVTPHNLVRIQKIMDRLEATGGQATRPDLQKLFAPFVLAA